MGGLAPRPAFEWARVLSWGPTWAGKQTGRRSGRSVSRQSQRRGHVTCGGAARFVPEVYLHTTLTVPPGMRRPTSRYRRAEGLVCAGYRVTLGMTRVRITS